MSSLLISIESFSWEKHLFILGLYTTSSLLCNPAWLSCIKIYESYLWTFSIKGLYVSIYSSVSILKLPFAKGILKGLTNVPPVNIILIWFFASSSYFFNPVSDIVLPSKELSNYYSVF